MFISDQLLKIKGHGIVWISMCINISPFQLNVNKMFPVKSTEDKNKARSMCVFSDLKTMQATNSPFLKNSDEISKLYKLNSEHTTNIYNSPFILKSFYNKWNVVCFIHTKALSELHYNVHSLPTHRSTEKFDINIFSVAFHGFSLTVPPCVCYEDTNSGVTLSTVRSE